MVSMGLLSKSYSIAPCPTKLNSHQRTHFRVPFGQVGTGSPPSIRGQALIAEHAGAESLRDSTAVIDKLEIRSTVRAVNFEKVFMVELLARVSHHENY